MTFEVTPGRPYSELHTPYIDLYFSISSRLDASRNSNCSRARHAEPEQVKLNASAASEKDGRRLFLRGAWRLRYVGRHGKRLWLRRYFIGKLRLFCERSGRCS